METPQRQRRRAIIIALVLGSSVIINLLFLMYAFVQKSEADKQRTLAVEQRKMAMRYREECLKANKETEELRQLLAACQKAK